MRSQKHYDLKNGFGVICTTDEDNFSHEKSYSIEVVMLTVPWQEVVVRKSNINTSEEANLVFKELVEKYRIL